MPIERNKRNQSYGLSNPLQSVFPEPIISNRDPTTNDIKQIIGTQWINTSSNNAWVLTSVSAGSANWEPISTTAGGNAPITLYVVSQDGTADYTTIQSALDAANAAGGGIVYVRPAIYTENLTCYDNTQVIGTSDGKDNNPTILDGVHVPPTTGVFVFSNLRLENSATNHLFNSAAAGSARLFVRNSNINVSGYTYNLPNWTAFLHVESCFYTGGKDDGVMNNTSTAQLVVFHSEAGKFTTNPLTCNNNIEIINSIVDCPIVATGSAQITAINSLLNYITLNNNATVDLNFTIIDAIAGNAAITQSGTGNCKVYNCSINSTNNPAIAGVGPGIIDIENTTFVNNANIGALINTTRKVTYNGDIDATSISFDKGVNKLDVYEEGSFTPILNFGGASVGITYSLQNGFYVKIGKLIYISVHIILTSKGSSVGAAHIGNLPFTSQATRATGASAGYWSFIDLTSNYDIVGIRMPAATNQFEFRESGDNNVSNLLTNSDFANNTEVSIQFFYEGN